MATKWICLTLVVVARGQPWPWKAPEFSSLLSSVCVNASHVCDPDQLLAEEEQTELTLMLTVEGKECSQGLSIGVAFAQQTFHQKRDKSLDPFAEELREKWQLSECHNDLVLFMANDSQTFGLSLGNGSRSVFGQSFEELARNLNKEFERKSSFFQFTSDACHRLLTLFDQRLTQETDHWSMVWNMLLTTGYLLVIVVILGIACYYCCYRKGVEKPLGETSVVSSEMTTKYSELRPTIEMSERNSK